jgi:two-component SAPR family response regulator
MQPNAMYLFGNFQVFNSKGQDISFMFTDKLRQIICLMMQYGKEGIPSRHLGNIMWGDKTADKIKNSRSVAINHLRKALEELTGIEVIYKNSNFILNTQQPFYCDYQQLLELISSDGILSEADINEILLIVGRGKFLSFNDNGTLDSFRTSADEQVLAVLRNILHIAESEDKIPIMLKTINCIFNIDPINDEAYRLQIRILKRLGRNLDIVEAQLRYKTACKEYYGQEITIS